MSALDASCQKGLKNPLFEVFEFFFSNILKNRWIARTNHDQDQEPGLGPIKNENVEYHATMGNADVMGDLDCYITHRLEPDVRDKKSNVRRIIWIPNAFGRSAPFRNPLVMYRQSIRSEVACWLCRVI